MNVVTEIKDFKFKGINQLNFQFCNEIKNLFSSYKLNVFEMCQVIMLNHVFSEFWRRAAALGVGLPPSDGYGQRGSLSSPGGAGSGGASSGSPGGADMPRRQRSVFSSQQVAQLEAYFRVSEYIDGERKKELSTVTNLPEQQIKVWFQNRRQKKKRESEPDYMSDSAGGGNLQTSL